MKLNLDVSLISRGETVAVGFSGGKDSSCLLHALLSLSEACGFTVKAVTVEHGIRGDESVSDLAFCVSEAKRLGVEIKTYRVSAPEYSASHGTGMEESARILRYGCFDDALSSGFADKIALAHHADDQAETILFNLFRGSGVSGVGGMRSAAFGGKIIRPMLNATRREIDLYADFYKIPFVVDSTNLSDEPDRNYLRGVVLPAIYERFPFAAGGISRFSRLAAADDEFLTETARPLVRFDLGRALVPISAPAPLFTRASIIAMKRVGVVKDYTLSQLEAVSELRRLETGKKISLPFGVVAVREYDDVAFYPASPSFETQTPLSEGVFTVGKYRVAIARISGEQAENAEKSRYKAINGVFSNFVETFVSTEACRGAVIRTPKTGDLFTKIGGGTKTLKKHLVDRKIPSLVREGLPIIASGNIVLAVCGVEVSEKAKIAHSAPAFSIVVEPLSDFS